MRLATDESFKAVALFEPDPELADNPGYLEYYDHWDQQAKQYVPCAGDKCPFCAANDNPSTRAMGVWYFPENDKADQIKVFTSNFSTTQDLADESEEEEGILGKKVRIKRMDDKGGYKVRVLADKPLTKTELKKALALLKEKFPDGLEAIVEKQLVTQMERLKAQDALEDDDDDEDEDVTDEADDEEDEDEDEAEEEDDDEEDEEDEEEDEDEEEADDEEEDEDEEESDDEDIVGGEFEIVKINEKDETFELSNDEGKVKMWLGEGVDVDYDEAKPKAKVSVNATTDDEGDWIITEFSVLKKARATRRKPAAKTPARKTGTRKK